MPGGIYGPGDNSDARKAMDMFLAGKMPVKMFPETGFTFAHVDDIASGILLALDKGRSGEAYILAGEISTLGGLIDTVGEIVRKSPPKFTMPPALIKAMAPLGRFIGPLLQLPPNFRELVASAEDVTYWARPDKAVNELGWSARPLEQGLRDTLKAEGKL
jgi:dihydroflavonol-4-reductase